MTTPLSRRGFAHPAQGAAGDASLYSNVEALYQAIGDDSLSRWFTSPSVANGATVTLTHTLNLAFAELTFRFYTYTGTFTSNITALTRQAQGASGVSVIANVTNPTTQVDITNNTGGTISIATLIAQVRYAEKLSDLSDANTAGAQDGQALVYDAGTSKFIPGASGDASFKLQSVSANVAVVKSGAIFLDDARELYLSADATFNLKSAVNSNGVTSPAASTDYYLYLDLSTLPASSLVGASDRKVYAISSGTSGQFIILALTPDQVDLSRYVPLDSLKTDGSSNYVTGNFANLAVRRHDANISSGAGAKNYLQAQQSSVIGWTASGAGVTVLTDVTAADLPRPNTTKKGVKFTGVSGSTAYAYARFTLDPADYNVKQLLAFAQSALSGYVSNDFKIDVYSNTASDYSGTSTRLALSTDVSSVTGLTNSTGLFRAAFDAPGSAAPYIEVRVGLNGTNSHAIVLSDIYVGPSIVAAGAAVGPWIAFTPTITNIPTTSTSGYYRRVGDSMEIRGDFIASGAATSSIFISIPSGFTINTAAIDNSDSRGLLGLAMAQQGGVYYSGSIVPETSTQVIVRPQGGVSGSWNASTPFTWANTNTSGFAFSVPVNEWAGSGTLSLGQNNVEFASNSSTSDADDTTSFVYGPSGSTTPGALTAPRNKRVRFSTPIQVTDELTLEFSKNQTEWFPITSWDPNTGVQQLMRQNATVYGVGLNSSFPATITDVDVEFGRYFDNETATYGGAGTAWSTGTGYWRLKKTTSGQAVGFGLADRNNPGLVKQSLYQQKNLNSTVTTSGTAVEVTDLAFSGLVSGLYYRYTHTIYNGGTAAADVWIQFGLGSDSTKYHYYRVLNGSSVCISKIIQMDSFGAIKTYIGSGSSGISIRTSDNNSQPAALTGGNGQTTFAVVEQVGHEISGTL